MHTIKSLSSKQMKQDMTLYQTEAQIGRIKGKGLGLQKLVQRIQRLAPSQLSILIQGETGSGKELCAQALHQHSKQAHKKLVSVNCAAIPGNLLNAELFGSESNAYTGACQRQGLIKSASGSTLFLDEVADLSLTAQAALLRVLESGELRALGSDQVSHVDIRLVCATHKDLTVLVQEGKFRSDLYHRITGAVLYLPPLRERLEDLADLVFEFSPQVFTRLQSCAWSRLKDFAWPGNIRQLKNVIHCLEIESIEPEIFAKDLPLPAHGPWRALPAVDQEIDYEVTKTAKHLLQASADKYLVTGSFPKQQSPQPPASMGALSINIDKHNDRTANDASGLKTKQIFKLLPPLSLDEFKESYVQFVVEKNQGNISKSAEELEVSRCLIYRVLQAQQKKVA